MSISLQDIEPIATSSKRTSNTTDIWTTLNKDILQFKKELGDKKKEKFYQELSILFAAGLDIKSALELIVEEQDQNNSDYQVFESIKKDVVNGVSLSQALKNTQQFSSYEYYSIEAGEESGKLPNILKNLADHYQEKIARKRQIMEAVSYPALVITAAFGVIVFMLQVLIPMFERLYRSFKGELPALTKFFIALSNYISSYYLFYLVVIVGVVLLSYSQRKAIWYRDLVSKILLKTPLIGVIVRKIFLARFCGIMQLLIAANTPLIDALRLVKKMIGFYPIEKTLETIEQRILSGATLHETFAAFSIYDRRMITLIKVAEEVNQLEEMFDKLAKQYGEDVKHQTDMLNKALQPVLMIILGIVVAIVALGLFLPIINLGNVIS